MVPHDHEAMMETGKRAYAGLCRLDDLFNKLLAMRIVDRGGSSHRHTSMNVLLSMARSLLSGMKSMWGSGAGYAHQVVLRALWEYYLDFETIRRTGDESEAERWLAFGDIQRWNKALKTRRARKKLGLAPSAPAEELLTDTTAEDALTQAIDRLWPGQSVEKIATWNCKSVRVRAEDLGAARAIEYVEAYGLLSWASHGSSAGSVGVSREYLDSVSAYCILHFLSVMLEMTRSYLVEVGLTDEEARVAADVARYL